MYMDLGAERCVEIEENIDIWRPRRMKICGNSGG
jgi:hypothetical protein